jgi:hypothetical protein
VGGDFQTVQQGIMKYWVLPAESLFREIQLLEIKLILKALIHSNRTYGIKFSQKLSFQLILKSVILCRENLGLIRRMCLTL